MFSQKYGVIHLLPVCRYYNEFFGGNLWEFQLIDEKSGFLNVKSGFQSPHTHITCHRKLLRTHSNKKYRRNRRIHLLPRHFSLFTPNIQYAIFLSKTDSTLPHTPSHLPPSAYVPSVEARFLPEEGSAGSWQRCPFSGGCPGFRE